MMPSPLTSDQAAALMHGNIVYLAPHQVHDLDDLIGMDNPHLEVNALDGWQFDFGRRCVTTSAWESRMSDGYRERQKEAKR